MSALQPLDSYPLIRTRDVDQMRAGVSQLFVDPKLVIVGDRQLFDCRMNYRHFQTAGLLYGTYGAPIDVRFQDMSFFVQGITLDGACEQRSNGRAFAGRQGGVLWPEGSHGLKFAADFAFLALKMNKAAVIAKLEALTGEVASRPLEFEGETDFRRPELQSLRRLVRFLSEDMDAAPPSMPQIAVAEAESAAIAWFLCGNRHNYSHMLDREPGVSAPWQVRLAEEYIAACWDQPITVEALTAVTGCSVRSLFHSFRQSRDTSPMAFLKQTRLRHAQQMLVNPTPGLSVIDVVFACGFGNAGHFAKDYREAFGELPSQTLSRHKSRAKLI